MMFYETTAIIRTIGKNEKIRLFFDELAEELGRDQSQLAAELSHQFTVTTSDKIPPFYRELLRIALQEVNWKEVADSILNWEYTSPRPVN